MGSSSRFVSRGLLTAFVVGLTSLAGIVLSPGAWADVTVTPSQAEQGGAVNVIFRVPEDPGTVYTTKVEIQVPTQAPIGEVYPLSVTGWAPTILYQNLAKPIKGIHGVTSSITRAVSWTRVGAPAAGAPKVNEFALSMGPLPTINEVPFAVVQTYSNGTVRRSSGPVLKLTPVAGAVPGAEAPANGLNDMQGMEGMPGMGAPAGAENVPATPVGQSDSGGPLKFFLISLVGGLLFFALIAAWIVTNKQRPMPEAPDDDRETDQATERATEKTSTEQHA